MEKDVSYHLSYHTVDGYAGGQTYKAGTNYAIAHNDYQTRIESGKYTWLCLNRLTSETLEEYGSRT